MLAIPPLVPLLHTDLQLSETGIGVLSSLPTLLFAAAAVPGALLIARLGALRTLVAGLLVTAVASALRGAASGAGWLYSATILMGAGVSIMQPSLPRLVRARFPERIGLATAVYMNGLLLGETAAVALTVPVVLPLAGHSWRLSLVLWALPVLGTAVLVALFANTLKPPQTPAAAPQTPAAAPATRLWWPDWRSPRLWRLGLVLGSINAMYFATNAFLPDYLLSLKRPDLISAALTALNLGQVPASFVMLGVADRLVRQASAYTATGAVCLASVLGMLASNGWWIIAWAALLGFALAAGLTLAFALPPVISAPEDVPRTSAGMFTISYSWAMLVSVLCGWIWDATGLPLAGFGPVVLCALAIIALAPAVLA